ncbi:hypothetical protein NC653_002098 [Populus alba x Populus x berolinensis]|uniref:Uncharacterized protein n=1 Tax=Populus alba x Populus x berolinensis TaxID=444605 RepID=A0AAD6RN95_9ROSI|nr:hypothetical protein NC653_002098 [Populus alba x Populus x berolinensis]
MLESQGLKLSKLLLVLLRPYIEEVARRAALDVTEIDESSLLSPRYMSPLSAFSTFSDSVLVDSGMKFMDIIEVSWPSSVILRMKNSVYLVS